MPVRDGDGRRRRWWASTATSTTSGCGVAAAAVRAGARLLATNDDATYPTPAGPIPGGGAILAAVAAASRRRRRPSPASRTRRWPTSCGIGSGATGTMVGDRPDTDGRFARALGYRFALVLSGVTDDEDEAVTRPDVVAADLAALVDRLVPEPGRVLTLASTRAAPVGWPRWPRTTCSSATSTPACPSRP